MSSGCGGRLETAGSRIGYWAAKGGGLSPQQLRELKKASSIWAAAHHESTFAWQPGYGAFAVSHAHCPAVSTYIHSQEEHHRETGFLEEMRRLLERNGVVYHAQYLV